MGGWTEVERRASDSINVRSEHRDINQRSPPNTALLIPQADTNNLSTCEVPGVRGTVGQGLNVQLPITQQITQKDGPMLLPVALQPPSPGLAAAAGGAEGTSIAAF